MASIPHYHGGGGGGGGYAQIVGKFNHEIQLPGGNPHARLALDVNNDSYEADINTHSNDGSNVQVFVRTNHVDTAPQVGVFPSAKFSYDGAGLKQSDFQSINSDDFHNDLVGWAKQSYCVSMNGMTYTNSPKPGDSGQPTHGIHDIHDNTEQPGQGGSKDGYAAFYIPAAGGGYDVKEVYTKFDTQKLADQGTGEAPGFYVSGQQPGVPQT